MTTHDPREHVRYIHQILISDKKRIGFLFGAGTSLATGLESVSIPAIETMTKTVMEKVQKHSKEFKSAAIEIRSEIDSENNEFTIESLLSKIETKRTVIGEGRLNNLDADGFTNLGMLVRKSIVELVSVHDQINHEDRAQLSHAKLASWVSKAKRRFPVEIFTTNYDYLFELALEGFGVPYFDGFSGSFEPFFCPEAVEDMDSYPDLVKLWKMHGSLGWTYRERDRAVIRQQTASQDSILIYPSHLKYDTTKKQPYVGLIDRLCAFLQQDDAVLFTCGYSFADNHINERIATSLRRGGNSHVIAMFYDKYSKDGKTAFKLAEPANSVYQMATNETGGKMSAYGIRHAVIGGKLGKWQLRSEPEKNESIRVSQYFDEDAAIPLDEEGEHKGGEIWEGTGQLILPDFLKLTEFLDDLSSSVGPSATI